MYPGRVDSPPVPPSYGGIMVFQEIKIDIEETVKGSTGANLVSTRSQDTIAVDHSNSKISRTADIEMRPMGHVGTNVEAGGRRSVVRGLHGGDVNQVATFVDVLFAECVEGR